ncbi:hypothetical protein ASC77_05225 [Nocardioides sp. Root1257]|uniref:MDR family NADP-dependent oxidoreductase n=1 Tax=unclassified Nocardioides TaxID=2615069 RepID=UPI0006F229F5|nr:MULTISPECIES: NADP-dependent oxidoreductase [unclassified Nocardioides]KQW53670.1 hypothetical protein ASC77_05225 [Nocardioides sp. Root1257]KRC56356.1 hypothetical protein ASE24_05225 [Nocardioides sp. Root224]
MQQVVVTHAPDGVPAPEDFDVVEVPGAALAEGEVRVAVRTLSLDPHVRTALRLGAVPAGHAVAEVVESRCPEVEAGQHVLAETGWRSETVVPGAAVRPVTVPRGAPLSAALGVLGMPGLTAYAAHVRHLRPRSGATVVIGAATGGVGAVAGQLARVAGARVVGVVGSDEKARLATERLGYADVVRRGAGLGDALVAACPDGIDAYLHLGDQATLDAVMERLSVGARVSLCGLMDQANGSAPTRLRAGAVMRARAEVHGMVVHDHTDLAHEHAQRVGDLLAAGDLVALEDRYAGLDLAPTAFARLMSGRNTGKVLVDVS